MSEPEAFCIFLSLSKILKLSTVSQARSETPVRKIPLKPSTGTGGLSRREGNSDELRELPRSWRRFGDQLGHLECGGLGWGKGGSGRNRSDPSLEDCFKCWRMDDHLVEEGS